MAKEFFGNMYVAGKQGYAEDCTFEERNLNKSLYGRVGKRYFDEIERFRE